jgi:hypothetical protein
MLAQDFRRIAMHLENRTTGDCVAHYYRIQKLDEFAAVRRKQQLKKRRQQSEVNRSITYLGIASVTGVKRGDHPLAHPGGMSRLLPNVTKSWLCMSRCAAPTVVASTHAQPSTCNPLGCVALVPLGHRT